LIIDIFLVINVEAERPKTEFVAFTALGQSVAAERKYISVSVFQDGINGEVVWLFHVTAFMSR